jgi:hypothetical protein
MSLVRINKAPSRRELAWFGVFWLIFFVGAGVVFCSRDGSPGRAVAAWLVAVLVPVIGWLVPAFMRIVYLGMSWLTFPIGYCVSYAVMAVVYYLVLTPVGWVMRLLGHDPLHRRFDARAQSYWVPRERDESIDRYFRQW